MTPSYRALTLPLASVVLVLGLAGCGTDDGAERAPAAAPPSTGATSAVVAGPFNPDDFVDDLLKAIDAESTVHLSIDAPGMGRGEADVDWSGGDTTIRVDADVDLRGKVRLVIADHVVYVDQGDGMFAVIDKTDPSYGPLLARFEDLGPHDAVEGLRAGITSVVQDGSKQVDGDDLHRYRVRVDPSKARGAFNALAGTSGISEDVEFALYVDDDALLRRVEVAMNGETTTVTLDRWSEPVAITVPRSVDLVTP